MKKRSTEEHDLQCAAIPIIEHLFRLRWPEYIMELIDKKTKTKYKVSPLHANPNGGYRGKKAGGSIKAEGGKSGIWDLSLPIPRGCYTGLEIEVKRPYFRNKKNGGLEPNQIAWGDHYDNIGRMCVVCYSTTEIIEAVENYMEGKC